MNVVFVFPHQQDGLVFCIASFGMSGNNAPWISMVRGPSSMVASIERANKMGKLQGLATGTACDQPIAHT
jgi:hypothetical protein